MPADKEQAKKELIQRYLENRQHILEAAASLPIASHNIVFVGEWTIIELLAHLCGWDHTFLAAFQQILDSRLPDFFSDYDHNWQRFNYRLVARYRQNNLEEMRRELEESQTLLAGFLHGLPAEQLFEDCGICTENGYRVTISGLMESLTQEEHEHLEQIREFASTQLHAPGEKIEPVA